MTKNSTIIIVLILLTAIMTMVAWAILVGGSGQALAAANCPTQTSTPTWAGCNPCDPTTIWYPGCEPWMCQQIPPKIYSIFLPVTIK
jgi:hypothetical protein